jgi:hypothetical protein
MVLTILLAFQNCTQFITFFPKQTGPVKIANTWGQVSWRINQINRLLAFGKCVAIFHAVSGELATDMPRNKIADIGKSGESIGFV